jgi:hypothetical protein
LQNLSAIRQFKRGDDGKLRIVVHKSALPFAPN